MAYLLERTALKKDTILTEAGRSPWYSADGVTQNDVFVIGVAGGSASGKTRVAQSILQRLGVPWVLVIAQDNFYKTLTPEESKAAHMNNHDFDSPDSFDYEKLRECLVDLKSSRAVQIPQYSFVLHQRTEETTYLYGATVVIVEGIFVLHDPEIRSLLDLKIFVQCDSDLMLARRIQRDLVERGRSVEGVLQQYLRFVKPSFDNFILPTSRYADVIVPGVNNAVGIDLVSSHILRQLQARKVDLRRELYELNVLSQPATPFAVSGTGEESAFFPDLPSNVLVLKQTSQLLGIQTILRDSTTAIPDFIFAADRLSTLIIEFALDLLPYRPKTIATRNILAPYVGKELDIPEGSLCGVSILRSGASLESGLRRVLGDVPLGSVLIQSDNTTGEPLLYLVSLPQCLKRSRQSAAESWVLLMDSQIGTGSAALMALRVLLDHGVREDRIIFCCILVSRIGGICHLKKAFPKVRIVTSTVDDGLEERWQSSKDKTGKEVRKKVFVCLPGLGSFGDRYFGNKI